MGARFSKNKAKKEDSKKSNSGSTGISKPFPALTPQSYLPGSAGASMFPPIGNNSSFPSIGYPPSPPPPYNPMVPSRIGPRPLSYPNMNQMSIGAHSAPLYDPGRRIRSCRRRPVVHIIESDSCSSISTCSSDRSCPPCQPQPIIILPVQYSSSAQPVPQQVIAGPIQYVQPGSVAPQQQQQVVETTTTYLQPIY